jgi:ABC-type Na+ efflux pump permease subunit
MAHQPKLIIQVARGSAVERQLGASPPRGLAGGEVVVEAGYTTADGHLEPPDAGDVVLSVPSPEALAREADEVRRVIAHAGTGVQPLVVVVEAAEELRDDELAAVLEAAGHAPRPVILRVLRDA